MKTSSIEYTGRLRTQSVHLRSGNVIVTDAPVDNQGKGEAFSPTDLLATSLGCCMLTVMGILAERKGWDLSGTRVDITKEMAADPRRVAGIKVELRFPARGFSQADKMMLERTARTCPVALSLHPEIRQEFEISWE